MARTALVVDDDPSIRTLVRTYLELEGYEVADADDGPACLSALHDSCPDVIVLDVMMPGMDGIAVTRHIRAGGYPPVPIVILTAATDFERRWAATKAGANGYLTKPVSLDDLVAEIDRVLVAA